MDIAWAFNGEPISAENADQFSITKGKRLSVLSIDAVAARHAGEYTCTASNKAGASSHTAALAVNGNTRACKYIHTHARSRLATILSPPGVEDKMSLLFIIPLQFPHHPLQAFSTHFHALSSTGDDEDASVYRVWLFIVHSFGDRGRSLSRCIKLTRSDNDAAKKYALIFRSRKLEGFFIFYYLYEKRARKV